MNIWALITIVKNNREGEASNVVMSACQSEKTPHDLEIWFASTYLLVKTSNLKVKLLNLWI